jgi:hypothetical protein
VLSATTPSTVVGQTKRPRSRGLAAGLRFQKHTALLGDGRENGMLVDAAAALLAQSLDRLTVLPEGDGLAADVGIGHPDVLAPGQFDEDRAEIAGIVFDPKLADAVIDQMGQRSILVDDAEQVDAVTTDQAFLKRKEVMNQGGRISGSPHRRAGLPL